MFQLIITVVAIGLTAALATVSLNYLPWWLGPSQDFTTMLDKSLAQVAGAYELVARNADGEAPEVTGSADGGFAAHFMGVLKFVPAAPPGYGWSYGKRAEDGSAYAGMNYFCLRRAGGQVADKALVTAVWRVLNTRPVGQMVVNTGCGANANYARSTAESNPLAITYYVVYTPGIPR